MYLVSVKKRSKRELGLFEAWFQFIKGPSDHVEIAFVRPARPIQGFGITYKSRTAKFGQRIYDEEKQHADFEWYEILDMDEKACETYCASRVGIDRISLVKMTQSAMPFQNESIAKFVTKITTGIHQDDEEEGNAYCVTTTMNALIHAGAKFDVDSFQCTASDVVQLVQRRLRIIKQLGVTNKHAESMRPAQLDDDLRSERWV